MTAPPLACSVRDCGLWLESDGASFTCSRGHAFDVAADGYVNLLQPQDRRARQAGDAPAAVSARARLLAAGVGRELVADVAARVSAAVGVVSASAVVVDLGCGCGELLGVVTLTTSICGVGIDLSTAAAACAARAFPRPRLTWVVANADRRLPLLDRSIDVVVSLHARRNAAECARVLSMRGTLLVAVPAPDDLVELRTEIQEHAARRDRSSVVIEEHAAWFELTGRGSVRERVSLTSDQVTDVLRATYRGQRRSEAQRAAMLSALEVTLASDVLEFTRLRTS